LFHVRFSDLVHLSYVSRSAKYDAKFFNFFARLFSLFYFRSEKFRTLVNGKINRRAEKVDKFCRSVNVALPNGVGPKTCLNVFPLNSNPKAQKPFREDEMTLIFGQVSRYSVFPRDQDVVS